MAIIERGEGSAKRRERLAQLKRGAGTFVYLGGHDVEFQPTPLKIGRNEPLLDESGMPVVDGTGRQVFKPAGGIARDSTGKPMLGGDPKVVRHKLDELNVRGVVFPKGKPVKVEDAALALKLRCMQSFEEVEEKSPKADKPKDEPKK